MLLFLAASVYGVIVALRLSLAFPASIAEGLPAWAAIRRSNRLTQGAKLRIFLVLLVIYALAYAAEMVGGIVLLVVFGIGALAAAALHVALASAAGVILCGLGAICALGFFFLWIALIWSAFSTSFAVLYHDQRLRTEGALPAPVTVGEPA
jgi:membrane-anchored glycerophosphoryl diester phosphodiesterase (GDPDase)